MWPLQIATLLKCEPLAAIASLQLGTFFGARIFLAEM